MLKTILKDDELNYDCDVWFLKERRRKTLHNKVRLHFFFFFNPSQVKGWQIFHKHTAGKCKLMPIKCEINNVFCNHLRRNSAFYA